MKRTSRFLNVLLGGSYKETICARVLRSVDNGSKPAMIVEFLIDTAFLITTHEHKHVRGYDENFN